MDGIRHQFFKKQYGFLVAGVVAALCSAGCSATLFSASCEGNVDDVRSLLQKGAPVNQDRELWCASFHGHAEIAKLLLAHNADPNKIFTGHEHSIPLMAAISVDSADIVNALLARGAKVNMVDRDGNTPLSLAAIHRNEAIIKVLIQHGADVDAAFSALARYGDSNTYCNLLAQNARATLEKCRTAIAAAR